MQLEDRSKVRHIEFRSCSSKDFKITEYKMWQFRMETFSTFNHAPFFGPVAVNGDFGTGTFGPVVKAARRALCKWR
jgi:hypothetical protein